MVKKISVLAILVAAIGLFAWYVFFANQADINHSVTKVKPGADMPVVSDRAPVQKAQSAAASVAAPATNAASGVAATDTMVSVSVAGGRFYDVDGDVSIVAGHAATRQATKNDKIVSGTVINVGDKSHAVLIFDDDQIVYMQPNSTFEVRDYRYDPKQAGNNNIDFSISQGGLRFITGKIGQQNHKAFKLITPSGTVDIRGTEFSVVVEKDKSVYTNVVSGGIGMTNSAGTTVSTAGQTALTASSSSPTAVIPATAAPANIFHPLDVMAKKSGVKSAIAKAEQKPSVKHKAVSVKVARVKRAGAVDSARTNTSAPASDNAATAAAAPVAPPMAVPEVVNAPAPDAGVGQLVDMRGDVKVALDGQAAQAVAKGAPLQNGMNVSTGDQSSAVLKFEDGEEIALESNSSFKIEDYRYDPKEIEKSNMFFSVLKGGLRAVTGLIGKVHHDSFKLNTPNSTIGIRGTDFMWIIKDGKTYIEVLKGSVAVTSGGVTQVVNAGEICMVSSLEAAPSLITASALPAEAATEFSNLANIFNVAGGAATGGAAIGATAGATATGVSGTAIAIGVGVAAGAAALITTSTTTHH